MKKLKILLNVFQKNFIQLQSFTKQKFQKIPEKRKTSYYSNYLLLKFQDKSRVNLNFILPICDFHVLIFLLLFFLLLNQRLSVLITCV